MNCSCTHPTIINDDDWKNVMIFGYRFNTNFLHILFNIFSSVLLIIIIFSIWCKKNTISSKHFKNQLNDSLRGKPYWDDGTDEERRKMFGPPETDKDNNNNNSSHKDKPRIKVNINSG